MEAIKTTLYKKQNEHGEWEDVEMRTIELSPVYSSDPNDENRRFWDATPTGKIKLGVINPEASFFFQLGVEYYVDFKTVGLPATA